MKFTAKILGRLCLTVCVAMAQRVVAQDSKAATPKPQTSTAANEVQTRLTIEVTGGEKNTPVENASVYVKFVEDMRSRRTRSWKLM